MIELKYEKKHGIRLDNIIQHQNDLHELKVKIKETYSTYLQLKKYYKHLKKFFKE